ncbi:MAG: hypothetical protein Q6L68_06435, partial [Thermostichus sp. DG02_5_bins_236]
EQGQRLDPERVRRAIHEELLTNKTIAWLKSQTTVNWVDSEGKPTEAPLLSAADEDSGEPETPQVPEAEFGADEPETAEETTAVDGAEVEDAAPLEAIADEADVDADEVENSASGVEDSSEPEVPVEVEPDSGSDPVPPLVLESAAAELEAISSETKPNKKGKKEK